MAFWDLKAGHFARHILLNIFISACIHKLTSECVPSLVHKHHQTPPEALNFQPLFGSGNRTEIQQPTSGGLYWTEGSYRPGLLQLTGPQQGVFLGGKHRDSQPSQVLHTVGNFPGVNARRRRYTYRPHLWTSLQVSNCYQQPPTDLLSPTELEKYEQSLSFHPVQMFHNEKLQHRTVRRKRQHGWSSRRRMRSFPQSAYHFQMGERKANSRRMRSSGDLDGKLQTSHRSAFSEPEISIHRLLIRPAIVELDEGTIRARLRYVIQLHKKMTGYYRLILEARITPDFPPIYVGKVQNVCAHWPANTAHSGCDARIPRFYQNGHVCFCHMSPGVYQQRLRLNMPNVLDGLEVPRFLVNILFSEKVFDIYLTLRLEKSKGELAGCVQVKIPLSLSST